MSFSLNKRLFSLLLLLFFTAGISYHHLCTARWIACIPCHCDANQADEQNRSCDACDQSVKLSETVQTAKSVDFALDFVFLPDVLLEQPVFPAPHHIVIELEVSLTDLPPPSILRDLKHSIPIRAPSVTV